MQEDSFYKDVSKATIALIAVLAMCRLTLGGIAVIIGVVGLFAALMRKPAATACCFIIFPLLVVFNRAIIGVDGFILLVSRFAFGLMVLAGILSGTSSMLSRERLPIGWILLYIAVSCISSIDGWMPLISYLKIFNFVLMLLGLFLLTKVMQSTPRSLLVLRVMFMAISVVMIIGSLLVYFVPSVGYSMLLYKMEGYGVAVSAADFASSEGKLLFNGMTCHSQMLSPVVACLGTWVLCDMLLIERKPTILHGSILACVPVLLYMSRSRGGILMLVCVIALTCLTTIPKARLPQWVKRKLGFAMLVVTIGIGGVGIYFQVKNEAISRWIRKTEDIAADTRTLGEAFTSSRQFLIERNLRDFKLNPIIGKGFQVTEDMEWLYNTGRITWFAASVEKGVTPYVILGEAGILGALAFLIFLGAFYSTCFRRGYMSLMTSFTCFLVANLADSTIFSPSGLGGFMWMVTCVGSFSTDCLAKRLHQQRSYGLEMV